jgi:hypothetical protein
LLLASSSSLASAQTILGVVTDSSGASVPNVVVEVKSPALIEQSRAMTTNNRGAVSFREFEARHLLGDGQRCGIQTTTQTGIELSADFNGEVNMVLEVARRAKLSLWRARLLSSTRRA